MEAALSKLTYYCNKSIMLYASAIGMAERANLRDIFRRLKRRRLKLLKFIKREIKDDEPGILPLQIDNLTDLLSEIKSNEEQLIEYSTELVKNQPAKSAKVNEFIKSTIPEITSSLHWLDVISSYYSHRTLNYLSIK